MRERVPEPPTNVDITTAAPALAMACTVGRGSTFAGDLFVTVWACVTEVPSISWASRPTSQAGCRLSSSRPKHACPECVTLGVPPGEGGGQLRVYVSVFLPRGGATVACLRLEVSAQ